MLLPSSHTLGAYSPGVTPCPYWVDAWVPVNMRFWLVRSAGTPWNDGGEPLKSCRDVERRAMNWSKTL